MKNTVLILLSVILSVFIGMSDLHQTDTPITVALILIASFIVGIFVTHRAWVYGIIIGLGVPVANFLAATNHWMLYGTEHGQKVLMPAASTGSTIVSLFTILVALFGIYVGQGVHKLFHPIKVF